MSALTSSSIWQAYDAADHLRSTASEDTVRLIGGGALLSRSVCLSVCMFVNAWCAHDWDPELDSTSKRVVRSALI